MKLLLVTALVALVAGFATAKPTLLGPLCLNMVNCFVDPCQVSRCAAHPDAKCVSNYCGGCNAFWYLNGQRVDCSAESAVSRVVEPETKCVTVNCFVNPCAFAKCSRDSTAVCRPNYCGGCNAYFYNAQNQRVQCD